MFPEHVEPQQDPLPVVAGPAGQDIAPPVQGPGQVPFRPFRFALRPPEDGLEVGQGQRLLKVALGQGEGGGAGIHSGPLLQLRIGDVGEGEEVQGRPVRALHHDAVPLLPRGRLPGAVGILLPGNRAVRCELLCRLDRARQPPQPQAQGAAGGQGGRPRCPAGDRPPPGGGQRQQFFVGLPGKTLSVHIRMVGFHSITPLRYSSSASSRRSFSRARLSRARTVPGRWPVIRAISSVE